MPHEYAICTAPLLVAKPYLEEEGFSDIRYPIQSRLSDIQPKLNAGELDMAMNFAAPVVVAVDAGDSVVVLGAIHIGCFELFAQEGIQRVSDLRGKTVAIGQSDPRQPDYAFMASILRFVGMTPDHTLVAYPREQATRLFQDGKVDAMLTYPPLSQQLRTLRAGSVILNSMRDDPWSNYYCCLLVANREWVEKHPVATKRALRSFLRGADHCVAEPEEVARYLATHGFVANEQYALEAMRDVPYDPWRTHDPEETLRFYALRLKDAGVINSTPEEIIDRCADWSFFRELREEMAFAPQRRFPPTAYRLNCEVGGDALAAGLRSVPPLWPDS
jgi:NitT/TauT family transport system substrate-binding protein